LFPTLKQNPGDYKLKVNGEVQNRSDTVADNTGEEPLSTRKLVPQCVKFLNCGGGISGKVLKAVQLNLNCSY
jgi:hypothetical protein